MNSPLVVSYFTRNTYYEKEVEGLIASCRKFNIEYDIQSLPCLGNWNANCHQKPFFILKCMEKHQRPLLWIDADGIICSDLNYFNTIKETIAVRMLDPLPKDHHSKVISATVYIQPYPLGFQILNWWCQESEKNHAEKNDQSCLRDVLLNKIDAKNFHNLPNAYCAIPGLDPLSKDAIVIQQTQASRLYQKIIDGHVSDFPFLKTLSERQLKDLRH